MIDFETYARQLKVLADPVRLKIVNMLSCMELCACSLLEGLSITQPTLSHHMKVLSTVNIVTSYKKGTWVYYAVNQIVLDELQTKLDHIRKPKPDCACYQHIQECAQKQRQKQ